jgi:hypothetical protein
VKSGMKAVTLNIECDNTARHTSTTVACVDVLNAAERCSKVVQVERVSDE